MSGMWFFIGVLCGAAVAACLPKRKTANVEKAGGTVHTPSKVWGETHNFLYYDGTVMPEIKEDLNE